MADAFQLRSFHLKVIFLAHFFLISLGCMGFWSRDAYLFYNSVLIVLLVWSIYHDQSHEPVQLAIVVNGSSILLDILLLILSFPTHDNAAEKFSAAVAIIHLLIRPVSIYVLIKNLEERSGAIGGLRDTLIGARRSSYEDIERPAQQLPQQSSAHSGGYDIASAPQI